MHSIRSTLLASSLPTVTLKLASHDFNASGLDNDDDDDGQTVEHVPSAISMRSKNLLRSMVPLLATAVSVVAASSRAIAAQGYRLEPSAEFKEEEQRTAAYNALQIKIRKDWDVIIEQLIAAEDPVTTTAVLNEMTVFLSKLDGIPTGIKKMNIVKICRKKKFNGRKIKPTWTTPVEIAYEKFISDFNKKVTPESPNKEKIY